MKIYLVSGMFLVIMGVMVAGCTTGSPGGQSMPVTPVPSVRVEETTAALTATQPTFALGDHYLQKTYNFQNESDTVTEQVRIDNQSWGIGFNITALSKDPKSCWFEMTVTSIDSRKNQTFGYGRTYPYDTLQQYPMYNPGLYKIEMTGNLVNVKLDVAKRLP
ncbi:MAG: hypothetical protein ACLQMU_06725 [Methanoregula sp.]|uniref:hypothetical protein n=2 Tax=Methanoregula sp. TaxID=2052170 RepID=UPI003C3B9238